jgi:hypothetical protein
VNIPVTPKVLSDSAVAPTHVGSLPNVDQIPAYQAFLKKALALGTEEYIQARSARRSLLLKILKPVDALTRTGPGIRAGALALAWSPLICAAPYIYLRFGLDAIVYGSLLPASTVTALLFWIVKSLQKSEWRPILTGTDDYVELEHTVGRLAETRVMRDAIVRSGRGLYGADLTLLKAYNRKREAEGQHLSGS